MGPFSSRRRREAERQQERSRRHQEEARAQAEKQVEIGNEGNRLQVVAIRVAIIGIVIGAVIAFVIALLSSGGGGATVAHARGHLFPNEDNAVVPVPVASLPTPPRDPVGEAGWQRCGLWWTSWLPRQGAAQVRFPPIVEISAPATAKATVVGVHTQVFRSYRPHTLTFVDCLREPSFVPRANPKAVHGRQLPVPGTRLRANLDDPEVPPTVARDDTRGVRLPMPPAVIDIDRGQTEHIAITPSGSRQRLYEWSIALRLIVDQRTSTMVFGSARRPLRSWLGDVPATAYDYDVRAHAWRATS